MFQLANPITEWGRGRRGSLQWVWLLVGNDVRNKIEGDARTHRCTKIQLQIISLQLKIKIYISVVDASGLIFKNHLVTIKISTTKEIQQITSVDKNPCYSGTDYSATT